MKRMHCRCASKLFIMLLAIPLILSSKQEADKPSCYMLIFGHQDGAN
jgi:hypothetical protein